MKVKKYKVKIIGNGEECKNCNILMQRREHSEITHKIRQMSYYFSEWDYCSNCKHVQHYEKFKVFNKTEKGNIAKYLEEQNMLFKNL